MKKALAVGAGLAAGLAGVHAFATDDLPFSSRMAHRTGVTAGLLSEPFPSIWGVGAGYHCSDLLRASLGYGEASMKGFHASTVSLQGTLLWPGQDLSPFLGLGVAHSRFVTRLPAGFIEQIEGSGSYVYSSIGLEWQSRQGFNIGLGYRFFLPWNGGVPGAQIGWYF